MYKYTLPIYDAKDRVIGTFVTTTTGWNGLNEKIDQYYDEHPESGHIIDPYDKARTSEEVVEDLGIVEM